MSLFEQLTELNQYYLDNKEAVETEHQKNLDNKREQARQLALETITKDCVEKMKTSAANPGRNGCARKEAKLYEWKFSDDCVFNGCYLRDLLNKGNLLDELQLWFDTNHSGEEGKRVFTVYYTMIGGGAQRSNNRRYAIIVSWNEDDLDRINNLIQRTKDRFDQSKQQQPQMRQSMRGNNRFRNNNRRFRSHGSNQQHGNKQTNQTQMDLNTSDNF